MTFSTPDAGPPIEATGAYGIDAERDIGGALRLENRGERHVTADLHAIVAPIDAALLRHLIKLGLSKRGRLRQARRRAAVERRPLAIGLLEQIVEVVRQATCGRCRIDQRHWLRRLPRR